MRDDFQVPNLGQASAQYSVSFFNRMVRSIEQTFLTMRAKGPLQVTRLTADDVNTVPREVAALPTTAKKGDIGFASNGRKAGEGVGAGTGVLVFYDGTAWKACDTGLTVSA